MNSDGSNDAPDWPRSLAKALINQHSSLLMPKFFHVPSHHGKVRAPLHHLLSSLFGLFHLVLSNIRQLFIQLLIDLSMTKLEVSVIFTWMSNDVELNYNCCELREQGAILLRHLLLILHLAVVYFMVDLLLEWIFLIRFIIIIYIYIFIVQELLYKCHEILLVRYQVLSLHNLLG